MPATLRCAGREDGTVVQEEMPPTEASRGRRPHAESVALGLARAGRDRAAGTRH